MEDMVDRVAKAICRAWLADSNLSGEALENEIANAWEDWTGEARAAIEAMREPSEAMVAAMDALPDWECGNCMIETDTTFGMGPSRVESAQAWRAMIDAALTPRDT